MGTITYRLDNSSDPKLLTTAQAVVWYDQDSKKVSKRTLKYDRGPGSTVSVRETVDKFSVDEDIPDEQFQIPRDK